MASLIDGTRGELALVEVPLFFLVNAASVVMVGKRSSVSRTCDREEGADGENERCCLTGQVCNSTS